MNTSLKSALLTPFNLLYIVSPSLTLKALFRLKQGYSLDLKNPKTYSEKIQWIKLHDKNSLMPVCSDKYAVRKYVEDCGFGQLLNELYWQGFRPEEIPFDSLPDKYVIKATHGSTFNLIVDDSKSIAKNQIIDLCNDWLKKKFLPCYGEWFYSDDSVTPSIIIERKLEPSSGDLVDYKVFVFHGKAKYVLVCAGRNNGRHTEDLYTSDWNLIAGANTGYPCSGIVSEKPECLSEMIEAAEGLAKPFNHARIDFYIVDGRLVFGEITFTSGSGFDKFSSHQLDLEMGSYLMLPN